MTALEFRDLPPVTGDKQAHAPRVRHVLLATDLGEASGRATEEAITLAARDNAVLQIMAVARSSRERADKERRIQLVRRHARAAGVLTTAFVWHGDPADAILEAAWTERPDPSSSAPATTDGSRDCSGACPARSPTARRAASRSCQPESS